MSESGNSSHKEEQRTVQQTLSAQETDAITDAVLGRLEGRMVQLLSDSVQQLGGSIDKRVESLERHLRNLQINSNLQRETSSQHAQSQKDLIEEQEEPQVEHPFQQTRRISLEPQSSHASNYFLHPPYGGTQTQVMQPPSPSLHAYPHAPNGGIGGITAGNQTPKPSYLQPQYQGQFHQTPAPLKFPPPPGRYPSSDPRRRDAILKGAPKFKGDGKQDPDIYFKTLRRYFPVASVWTEMEMLDIAMWSMQDDAQSFVHTLDPSPGSLGELEALVKQRFGTTLQQKISKFYRLRQQNTQTIRQYSDELRAAAMGTGIPEATIIHKFMSTLQDPRIQQLLATQLGSYVTLEQAATQAEIQFQANKDTKLVRSTFGDKKKSSASTTPVAKKGDSKPDAKIRCNRCGKLGHKAFRCPLNKGKKTENNEAEFQEIYEIVEEEDEDDNELNESDEEIDVVEEDEEYDIFMIEVDEVEVDASSTQQQKKQLYEQLKTTGVRKVKKAQKLRSTKDLHKDTMDTDPKPGSFIPAPVLTVPTNAIGNKNMQFVQPSQPRKLTQPTKQAPPVVPPQPKSARPAQSSSQQAQSKARSPPRRPQQPRSQADWPARSAPPVFPSLQPLFPTSKMLNQRQAQPRDTVKKALEAPVTLPLTVQLGLMSLASNNPKKFVQVCQNKAKAALQQLEVDMLEVNETKQVSSTNRQTYYLKVLLDGNPAHALVDSGAQVSIITSALVQFLQLVRPDASNLSSEGANIIGVNGTASGTNRLELRLTVGTKTNKRTFQYKFHVIESRAYKLLIGCDLLHFWRAAINFCDDTITIHRAPRQQISLQTRSAFLGSQEFQSFKQQMLNKNVEGNLAELLEVNTAVHVHNVLEEQVIDYLQDGDLSMIMSGMAPTSTPEDTSDQKVPDDQDLASFLVHPEQMQIVEMICKRARVAPHNALQALKDSYSAGFTPALLKCKHCNTFHLDDNECAIEPHVQHTCHHCQTCWLSDKACISNPLVAAKPQLENGKFKFEFVVVNEAEQSVPKYSRMELPPIPVTTFDKTHPDSPYNWDEQHCLKKCQELQLDPGDIQTLPFRLANFLRAQEENEKLVNKDLTEEQLLLLNQVLLDYADVLAFDLGDIKGSADFPDFQVEVTSKPIRQKPYRLTRQDTELVNKEVDLLKKAGMMEDSRSPWLSPTFVVRPSTHRARMVTDYRKVNAVTVKNAYPLPDIPLLFDRLSESDCFSTLDLKSGFYQIKVDPKSVPITAMGIDGGLYNYNVIPFGMCNAPAHFMNAINYLRQEEGLQKDCEAFVDDLTVHGKGVHAHALSLRRTLAALRKRNFKVAATKLFVGYAVIKLLGHIIGQGVVKTDPEKVAAIAKLQPPKNLRELRAFLGVTGYYRRFIPKFAQRSKNLTQLLKKDQEYKWNEHHQDEFKDLKAALQEQAVLALPCKDGLFKMYTDFCSNGVSAILHQVQGSEEKVIAYASKKCNRHEAALSSAEGELLAVVFGLSKFRHYLAGVHFELITDSAAVLGLKSTKNLSSKLMRWSLLIADFNFKMVHKPGKIHANADGLSRAATEQDNHDENFDALNAEFECLETSLEAIEAEVEISSDEEGDLSPPSDKLAYSVCNAGLALEQLGSQCHLCHKPSPRKTLLNCESCGKQYHPRCIKQSKTPVYWHCPSCRDRINSQGMVDMTEHESLQLFLLGKRDIFSPQQQQELAELQAQGYAFSRGLLYKVDEAGNHRIFPGPARRAALIDELHRRYMHLGARRLAEIASQNYYWPGLSAQVHQHVEHCLPCQLTNAVFHRRERLAGHLYTVSGPRQAWSLDLAPEITTQDGKRSFIVAVDDFSKFVKIAIVDKKSETIANWLRDHIFYEFGPPKQIRTDQGTEFMKHVKLLCIEAGVQQKFIERAAPWRNGRAERMVRTAKRMLKAVLTAREEADWPTLLSRLQYAINSATTRGLDLSPHEIFFGEKPPPLVGPADLVDDLQELKPLIFTDDTVSNVGLLQERQKAVQRIAQERVKQYQEKMEKEYANVPIREGVRVKQLQNIMPNTFAAVRNTQRGAWGTSGIGPFLVVNGEGNTITLQSLVTGKTFCEARENVIPLYMKYNVKPPPIKV